MRRPIVILCTLLLLFTAVRNTAEHPGREKRLAYSESLLCSESKRCGTVTLTGTVQECSAVAEGLRITIDQISLIQESSSKQSLDAGHKIFFTINEATEKTAYQKTGKRSGEAAGMEALVPGAALVVRGEARRFEAAGNPGQFDAHRYYYNQDLVCSLSDVQLLSVHPGKNKTAAELYRLRRMLRRSYERILGAEEAQTVSAVSLGEKAFLDREVKQLYQESGIAHIASVSGLHASLIGMGVYRILRRCLVGIGGSAFGSGAVLFLYVWMTGNGISAVRALVMFLLWLLAQVTGRKYDSISAIAAAAGLLLLGKPRSLTDASFLLSFSAVTVIAVLLPEWENAPAAEKRGKKKGYVVAEALRKALKAGFGIWFGMLPVTLYFFYQTPPWSILINLAVVPLLPFVMGLGLLAALLGLVSQPLGMFFAAPVHYLLRLLDWLGRLELSLPAAVWVAGRPSVWAILLYYALLVLAGRAVRHPVVFSAASQTREEKAKKRRKADRSARFIWGMTILCCLMLLHPSAPRSLEITCLDVGQGDGALLRFPSGEVCMIDGGSSTEKKVWNYRISQTVKYYGIGTIDYLFLSHADNDHISGIQEFLEEYEPGIGGRNIHGITLKHLVLPPTADPKDFEKIRFLAAQKKIAVSRMEKGAYLAGKKHGRKSKEWTLRALAPEEEKLSGDKNEDSLVLLLQYGAFRMLFTGDLEGEAENRLVREESGGNAGEEIAEKESGLRADVLKVGHHGSKNASSEDFLSQVMPKAAVISCAEENRYGHPSPETVKRLQDCGARIYSTAEKGAVLIRTDGEQFEIRPYRTGRTGE